MPYFPLTASDETLMLSEIGVKSFDELLAHIPKKLLYPDIHIPMSPGELSLQRELFTLSGKNRNLGTTLSFLGAGIYEHFIPSALDPILHRGEFLTAYTPYQAEASQGTLQVIYEFQTLICRLTGMDVSNASHYDGATALAEAVLLAVRQEGRQQVLIPSTLHPHYKEVLRTYLGGITVEIVEIPYTPDGSIDRDFIRKNLSEKTACLVVNSPNFFGIVENFSDLSERVHEAGALVVACVNPMSLSFYASPREWGADIACGEGQPLGIRPNFGGPVLGFFAATKELMRKVPGRIVGETRDTEGRRAFVLTLQAREQHIRREKATSNICSNQALMALAATLYLTFVGEKGFKRIGEMNVANAAYLKEKIAEIPKFSIPFEGPHFNEFAVRFEGNAEDLLAKLLEKNILGGVLLEPYYPELRSSFLVATTETKTREDLDLYLETLKELSR